MEQSELLQYVATTLERLHILHPSSGLKVDIIVPPDTPFNRSRFSRTTHVKPSKDFTATFSSAEDVILKKMEYYREGGSDKHLRDIASVMKLNNNLDLDYVARWAEQLDVIDIWRSILQRIAEE